MANVGFGRSNPFPFKFGGGVSYVQSEMDIIVDRLRDGFDPDDSSLASCYAYAEACMLGLAWSMVNRIKNTGKYQKTIDWLLEFEQLLDLRPTSSDSDSFRRSAVATRFKGFGTVNLDDIQAMSAEIMGPNLDSVSTVNVGDVIEYWPPNPGPPGYEWYSNRMTLIAKFNKNGISDSDFLRKVSAWEETMNRVLPVYADFEWHVGDGFFVEESILGEAGYA